MRTSCVNCLIIAVAMTLSAAGEEPVARLDPPNISLRNEIQHAIDKGLDWLKANQNTNGYWSTADQPAVTALALSAFMGEPSANFQQHPTAEVKRGYEFVTAHAKPDGAIYEKGLANYNTAICVMSLIASHNPAYEPMVLRARHWLLSQQVDLNEKGKIDSPFDGGVGYGDRGNHSDMNNTYTALEAIYYSKQYEHDKALAGAKDLNWDAAIHFIQSCQNLPAANKESWVSADSRDTGGFVYEPGSTKAGAVTNSEGKVALRSYGSISYAGLLSYIYADVKKDDPRVSAVYDWLQRNFTVNENPGMGQQGYYYYLHLMTKAMAIYGTDKLKLKDGGQIDWKKEVALKLIDLQKTDGSWSNENGRWWEHDPALVTSYTVMSLEILYRNL